MKVLPTRLLPLCGVLAVVPGFAETHDVPLFKAASNGLQQGFARVINHSDAQGTVEVSAVDDAGHSPPAITIALEPNGVVHFNSGDLEQGNAAKGLSGGIGTGSGDWRLTFDSTLTIEVLAFVRSWTGFVTPVHDVALVSDNTHYVPTFNPGSNLNQQSKLRMINPGGVDTRVTIDALDDGGQRSGTVTVTLDAGQTLTLTAAELEAGPREAQAGGAFGDGQGKWRLYVAADQPIQVMSLLEQPDGYLSNLSASRLVEGQLATVLGRLSLGDDAQVDPIDDINLTVPGQCASEVEVCVRDYSCEDGDEARITVNDSVVFEGELFNRWQCNLVSVNEGANSIVFLALNGTGFKGPCDHPDINTGELRVTARGGDDHLQRWRHRGGRGSSANLNITIAPRNEDACDVAADGDDHGDTRAEATDLALGGSQQGRLDDSDDIDVFRIRTTEAGTLTVHTTGDTDTFGQLSDSDGTVLASNDDGGEATNFRIEESLGAGTYFVAVSPYGAGGSYTVHARFVADGDGGGSDREGWLGTEVGQLNDPLSDIQPTVINGPAGMSVMAYAPIDSWTWQWVRQPRPGPDVPASPDLSQCVFVGTRDATVLGPDGMDTGSYNAPVVAGPPSTAGLSEGWNYRRNDADEKHGLQIYVSDGEVRWVECWVNGVEESDGRYESGAPDGYFYNFTNRELDSVAYEIRRDGGNDVWAFRTFRADPNAADRCGFGGSCGNYHGRSGRYENGSPDGYFYNFTNGELDGVAYEIRRDGGSDVWAFRTFRADPNAADRCGFGGSCGNYHGRSGRYENGSPDGYFYNFTNGELDGVAYEIRRDGGSDVWAFRTFRADPNAADRCGFGGSCGNYHGRSGRYESGTRDGWFGSYANGEKTGTWIYYVDGEERDRESH